MENGLHLKRYVLIVFVCLISANVAPAQTSKDIGSFDMNKVLEAIDREQQSAGDTGKNMQQAVAPKTESWTKIIIRVSGYLALVIVLIAALYWIVRRFGITGTTTQRGQPVSMDVLETLTLGQGKTLLLVRVMDSVLVLGQTAQNITVLDKIEGQKALDAISSGRGDSSIVQFKDLFNGFLSKIKKP